ncbi:transcription termination factor NusA [Patescibacteria group bacterium]
MSLDRSNRLLFSAEKEDKEKKEDKPKKDEKKEGAEKEDKDEEEEKRFNPRTDIGITEALEIKPDAELGDEIISELPLPDDFGRVAAQTAKQVIIQKLREAERETLFNQYKDRVGEIINATVHRVEGSMVYMDLGQATALMPPPQQVPTEKYNIGDRYKVYLLSVEQGRRGPEIIASRTAPEMVEKLFEMEVPEITSGSIEIKAVAREAGSRSKIAVHSLADNIDPIGSCVGQRGARVQTVMSELGGEKIDIIEYDEDSVKFIVNALSPAKVISVQLDEDERLAKAYVVEDQLSLAIGKGGQNVRLAAKLAGWKIDVMKEEGTGEEAAEGESNEEKDDDKEGKEEKVEKKEAADEKEDKKEDKQEEAEEKKDDKDADKDAGAKDEKKEEKAEEDNDKDEAAEEEKEEKSAQKSKKTKDDK